MKNNLYLYNLIHVANLYWNKHCVKLIKNPIIILVGYLITSDSYNYAKRAIENISGRKAYLADIKRGDGFKSIQQKDR